MQQYLTVVIFRRTALLSRETGGVSRFVTPRERVDLSAVDLFASIGRPIASDLKAGGNIQPEPPSLVFRGVPVLLFGEVDEAREGQIELNWSGGKLNLPVSLSESDIAETVWLLQGSRLITDWESRYPAAEVLAPLEKRTQNRVATRLLALSQTGDVEIPYADKLTSVEDIWARVVQSDEFVA